MKRIVTGILGILALLTIATADASAATFPGVDESITITCDHDSAHCTLIGVDVLGNTRRVQYATLHDALSWVEKASQEFTFQVTIYETDL